MFANKFKINLSTIASGVTATTITFPIGTEFQTVDNSELIDRVFVANEVENAINPILDYDKVRFLPLNMTGTHIDKVFYDIKLFDDNGTYTNFYGGVGFDDDDIKYRKNSFTNSFLNLSFYDTDNPLTQKLITYVTLFSKLNSGDIYSLSQTSGVPGIAKPANQIPINFITENPITNPRGFNEGYHIYDYKDGLKIGDEKYLYMRASFKNSKTGKSVNLMVNSTAKPINELVHELYTRVRLFRTSTGYYYEIDDTYRGDNTTGPNNVNYATNTVVVNLYQIKAT